MSKVPSESSPRAVTILGSTGSIGVSTLQVMALHPDRYRVHALTANHRVDELVEQCREFQPVVAVIGDQGKYTELKARLAQVSPATEVLAGADAIAEVAADSAGDTVVAAIVGAAGLLPVLAAVRAGKRLLLANKEALVMSGDLLVPLARETGAELLPLDSEHNAIFQCLPCAHCQDGWKAGAAPPGINQILLTASGGPFRGYTREQLSVVSIQQALKHPNWTMGPKITIDSATLMNKGLEVIEASFLFGVDISKIRVLVHPESIVHSMVSYLDGSVLAQLGNPDMRTPIAHALAWPERIEAGVRSLDLAEIAMLHFEEPDHDNFPALQLAFDAARAGGTAPSIYNAANEVAVDAFLQGRVSFLQLSAIVDMAMQQIKVETADDLETILNADNTTRTMAAKIVDSIVGAA